MLIRMVCFIYERIFMKKKISILLVLILAFGSAFGISQEAYSSEAHTVCEFAITHAHTGDSLTGTGCYSVPVYHVHKGNTEEGGECYTPHYHEHEGSPSEAGGCYTVPHYHVHTGSPIAEGGCYVPKYHVHDENCTVYKTCSVWKIRGEKLGYQNGTCYIHGSDIDYVTYQFFYEHKNCGAPTGSGSERYCEVCGFESSYTHQYPVYTCNLTTESLEGYVLGCNMTEEDIDYYETSCNLEGTIDRYDFTCSKTEEDIDSYDIGCPYAENPVVGKVIFTNEGSGTEVGLSAEIVDLSNGEYQIDDSTVDISFTDCEGNVIGDNTGFTTPANGKFEIHVSVDVPGTNETSFEEVILVNNVYTPAPDNGSESDNSNTDNQNHGNEGDNEALLRPTASPSPTPVLLPEDTDIHDNHDNTGSTKKAADNLDISEEIVLEDYPLEDMFEEPVTDTQIKELPLPTAMAKPMENLDINQSDKEGAFMKAVRKCREFISTPAGKVITVSVTSLLGAGLLLLLLLFVRNWVPVFNEDGEGSRHFLGLVHVSLQDGGFEIDIPQDIYEKAYTNRYYFFMGIFALLRNKDSEIIVARKDRRRSVSLSSNMSVTL